MLAIDRNVLIASMVRDAINTRDPFSKLRKKLVHAYPTFFFHLVIFLSDLMSGGGDSF